MAAVNAASGKMVGPAGLTPAVDMAPAKPGDTLTIYGIGFGATHQPTTPGVTPMEASSTLAVPEVTLDGSPLDAAAVLYAGVSPGTPGLYQLNIVLPPNLADGAHAIGLKLGGSSTAAGGYVMVAH